MRGERSAKILQIEYFSQRRKEAATAAKIKPPRSPYRRERREKLRLCEPWWLCVKFAIKQKHCTTRVTGFVLPHTKPRPDAGATRLIYCFEVFLNTVQSVLSEDFRTTFASAFSSVI